MYSSMRHGRSDSRGFTLVELLIVIVILGIMTMVAVPSYRDSVVKSRRTDARIALQNIAQALERCYTQFGRYDSEDCPVVAGSSPEGFYDLGIKDLTASTYTLTAEPTTAQNDKVCTELGLNHLGQKTANGVLPGGDGYPDKCW